MNSPGPRENNEVRDAEDEKIEADAVMTRFEVDIFCIDFEAYTAFGFSILHKLVHPSSSKELESSHSSDPFCNPS